MIDTEKFIKIIAEGNTFLTSISHLHPMKIKGILEGVYEMCKCQFPEVLQDEYDNLIITYLILHIIRMMILHQ